MIATVFGDVHDIGKSLVNTILTNNGYTVIDLGKQVPVDTIIDAAIEHEADAIGLSALLVSTSKQMPIAVQNSTSAGRLPGADWRGRDQPRLRPPHALPARQGVRWGLRAGRHLLQGRLPGLDTMDALIDDGPARHDRSPQAGGRGITATSRSSSRTRRRWTMIRPLFGKHRRADPVAALVGRAGGAGRFRRGLRPPRPACALQAPLGRGRQGARRDKLVSEEFRPRLERMWREQDHLHPKALARLLPPATRTGNELVRLRPGDQDGRSTASSSPPAQARPDLPGWTSTGR